MEEMGKMTLLVDLQKHQLWMHEEDME